MAHHGNNNLFRKIGKGHCGSVWAPDCTGKASAFKRADGLTGRSIENDSNMHQRIEHAFIVSQVEHPSRFAQLCILQHRRLISGKDTIWWRSHQSMFPAQFEACDTLETERILPLERRTREMLINKFCHPQIKDTIKASRDDEDCLVRPYLGRRTHGAGSRFFTLRNKPLHLNQMLELDLPVIEYAHAMADALAIIYWRAQVDARDIEFVLAPARPDQISPSAIFQSAEMGPHAMWILDFDCVRSISMDAAGVNEAATAFFEANDPFYPRPGSDDEDDRKLWGVFVQRFLQSSRMILGESSNLPAMLIKRLEEMGELRRRLIGLSKRVGDFTACE